MDVAEIGASEARMRLSELLDRVARGQVFRITKGGKPVAELRLVTDTCRRPRLGATGAGWRSVFDAPVLGLPSRGE
jgi:antitoxin (DNA-binding transcriptional repressor) of toxin-antitoxin stability system